MLKNAPLDAQNIKVWNAMIVQAFKEEKYQLAWQLYVDVRHIPNLAFPFSDLLDATSVQTPRFHPNSPHLHLHNGRLRPH